MEQQQRKLAHRKNAVIRKYDRLYSRYQFSYFFHVVCEAIGAIREWQYRRIFFYLIFLSEKEPL